jgi:hypothetical protein
MKSWSNLTISGVCPKETSNASVNRIFLIIVSFLKYKKSKFNLLKRLRNSRTERRRYAYAPTNTKTKPITAKQATTKSVPAINPEDFKNENFLTFTS